MKDHDGCKRGFVLFSQAWYAPSLGAADKARISFGMYHDEGGTSGEMEVTWKFIAPGMRVPELKAFDDSWSALASFSDLIEKMGEADGENIDEPRFVEMLLECGFEDRTPYEDPDADKRAPPQRPLSRTEIFERVDRLDTWSENIDQVIALSRQGYVERSS